ncbi:MAG: T9SS type A sorting domain-containing protein [candidate division WOR-3 bacterium]|nr:MAG: T9SS type A sorting domain-containing protein [candidate division WOR-3 bacterium]
MLKNRQYPCTQCSLMHYTALLLLLFSFSVYADPVVVSGGPANDYESWIIRANDSRLMVIFCRNPDWQSGDLYVTFSTDNGVSWNAPIAIVEGPGDQATLSFLQLPGDTFRLWYASNENTTYGIYTAHSVDGTVWQRDGRVNLGWQVYDMYYDPTVILEPDSSLTMSYRGPGGAYIAHKPYGGSWDTSITLVGPTGYRPRVMKHSDGTYLYSYHRNTTTGYEVFVRTSTDRVNWTAEDRLTFNGNSHDPFPNETTDSAYMIYYATHLPPAYNLYRRVSYDAIDWEPEEQITSDLTNNTQPHFFCEANEIYIVWAHAILFPDDHDVYFERCDYTAITETSEIATLRRPALLEMSPNPCSRMMRVKTPANVPEAAEIRIYDSQGRILSVNANSVYDGRNALTIDAGNLQAGVYFLRMSGNNTDRYARFVVVH